MTGSFKRIEAERTATAREVGKISTMLREHNEQQDNYTTSIFERLDGLRGELLEVSTLIQSLSTKFDDQPAELTGIKTIMNTFSERLLKLQTSIATLGASILRQQEDLKATKPLVLPTESEKPDEIQPAVQVPE